jgi:F0F1-type ATP synthase membrane subunit b/b'
LEAALASARQEAARIRGEHRARAQATERDVLGVARQAAEKSIGAAVQEIQQETAVARASLGDQARALSADIAARVLGRGASA